MASSRAALADKSPKAGVTGNTGILSVVRVDVKNWEAIFRVLGPDGKPIGPEFTTRFSMIQPLGPEDTVEFWNMVVKKLIEVLREEHKVPEFYKGFEVETGDDSTGDPAVYVTILISPSRTYSEKTISGWNAFTNLLHERLTAMRLPRYSYVRIGEKQKS